MSIRAKQVAPRAGARIETPAPAACWPLAGCRSPRGSADRNSLPGWRWNDLPYVAPRAGARIETFRWATMTTRCPAVAPRAGARIETSLTHSPDASAISSLPARERGSKRGGFKDGGVVSRSLPARERGSKPGLDRQPGGAASSLPARERGSKHVDRFSGDGESEVAPRAGARIETLA